MSDSRRSGIVCHPSSLPGPHGIGDFGESAFRFIEWLEHGAQSVWQILPLGPVGAGNSPYASPSAFAGNTLLISLPWLVGDGLLEASDLDSAPAFSESAVDYEAVRAFKEPLLRRAFERFRRGAATHLRPEFEAFEDLERYWLNDFALFMAIKEGNGFQPWSAWPEELVRREPAALASAEQHFGDEARFHRFAQFLFDRQWNEVRRHCAVHHLQVLGDIPIFVAYDSADVWSNQGIFLLDERGIPTAEAGVPPDAFSADGQYWGNPLYDWDENARTGYAWWIERVRAALRRVDMLRIDHFRGFAASWVIPAGSPTAAAGHWESGPGREIFDAIQAALGTLPFVVEDLGLITPDVIALRKEIGFPGMSVLQFGFDSGSTNAYLPHNFESNTVVYSGTHDNQTTIGWFRSLPEWVRTHVQRYLGRDGSDIAWDLIRLAEGSVAELAIVPLQDVMRLDDDARMNFPGTPTGNWAWRYAPHQLHSGLADGLRELTETYGRSRDSAADRGYDPYDYTAPGTSYPLSDRGGTSEFTSAA
jgi:4-alpha-glucanotransferase